MMVVFFVFKNILLPPFEDGKAGKDAKYAKDDQCIDETCCISNGGACEGTSKDGNVEDDGVPREMGWTVSGRNIFQHVVDVCTVDHGKEESTQEG